jgi:Na+/melibiose symporter-like transporter
MQGPEALIPIFGIIFTFGIPGVIVFWWLYTRHRERMRLIEKGLTPDEVKSYFANTNTNTKPRNPFSALKWGILITSLGFGIFIANLLEDKYNMGDGMTTGLVFIFAGAGFILYYALIKNRIKDNEPKAQ